MKKILALVLVLAVAQLASAAVWWHVEEADGPGLFNVVLRSDENVADFSLAQMVSSGAVFEVLELNDPGVWVGNFTTSKNPILDLGAYGAEGYGAALGSNPAGSFAIGDLLAFTVRGELGDIVTIQNLPQFGMNSFISTQATGGPVLLSQYGNPGGLESFELVPEPMTMALLGLGGLFIRRRRTA